MSNIHGSDIPSREITPESVYHSRRTFLRAAGLVAGVAGMAGLYRYFNPRSVGYVAPAVALDDLKPAAPGAAAAAATKPAETNAAANGFKTDEKLTPFETVAGFNNFYEFSEDKESVAGLAKNFVTKPWLVSIGGLCNKPTTLDLDDLKNLGIEDRVYRHRCVERWSMVIPWLGFPLAALLKKVDPKADAKFVRFVTLNDKNQFPGLADPVLKWPYEEGLRMDEAMNPLTLMAMGLYGKTLPPQNGAPLRLVVPWKYGFKGIKSIVKIELVKEMPPSSWNLYSPESYGFYSNVNPKAAPRWPQDKEQRLPDFTARDTLMFNGYGDQVASLYKGMDLIKDY